MRYETPAHAGTVGFWSVSKSGSAPTTPQKIVRIGLVGGLVAGALGLWLSGRRTSMFPPLYSAPSPDQARRGTYQ